MQEYLELIHNRGEGAGEFAVSWHGVGLHHPNKYGSDPIHCGSTQ